MLEFLWRPGVHMLWNLSPSRKGRGTPFSLISFSVRQLESWVFTKQSLEEYRGLILDSQLKISPSKRLAVPFCNGGERAAWEPMHFQHFAWPGCETFLWAMWIPQKVIRLTPFRKDPASVCSLQSKVTQKEESLGSILLEIWLEGGSVEWVVGWRVSYQYQGFGREEDHCKSPKKPQVCL